MTGLFPLIPSFFLLEKSSQSFQHRAFVDWWYWVGEESKPNSQ